MSRWFFRNWYWFDGVIAVIAGIALAVTWGRLGVVQWLMLAQVVVICLHFVEEFGMPGGFPVIANVVEKKSEKPSHWPLNQWTATVSNNWFLVFVYLPAFLFPDQTWLTLGVTMFGLLEVLGHGVMVNVRLKVAYNPGLWTTLLGFLPLGIAYLMYTYATGAGPAWWMYLVATAYPIATYAVVIQWLLVTVLSSKDTRFPFTDQEMARGSYYLTVHAAKQA